MPLACTLIARHFRVVSLARRRAGVRARTDATSKYQSANDNPPAFFHHGLHMLLSSTFGLRGRVSYRPHKLLLAFAVPQVDWILRGISGYFPSRTLQFVDAQASPLANWNTGRSSQSIAIWDRREYNGAWFQSRLKVSSVTQGSYSSLTMRPRR